MALETKKERSMTKSYQDQLSGAKCKFFIAIVNKWKSQVQGSGATDIVTLVADFKSHNCSLAVDKVFSLLGLASGTRLLRAVYSLTISKVICSISGPPNWSRPKFESLCRSLNVAPADVVADMIQMCIKTTKPTPVTSQTSTEFDLVQDVDHYYIGYRVCTGDPVLVGDYYYWVQWTQTLYARNRHIEEDLLCYFARVSKPQASIFAQLTESERQRLTLANPKSRRSLLPTIMKDGRSHCDGVRALYGGKPRTVRFVSCRCATCVSPCKAPFTFPSMRLRGYDFANAELYTLTFFYAEYDSGYSAYVCSGFFVHHDPSENFDLNFILFYDPELAESDPKHASGALASRSVANFLQHHYRSYADDLWQAGQESSTCVWDRVRPPKAHNQSVSTLVRKYSSREFVQSSCNATPNPPIPQMPLLLADQIGEFWIRGVRALFW